ncbi:MAG: hypothetical protein JJU15_13175 [Pararhodobacter sp.]|nr:hypothetical protein [Pararhodobacter sp.]
MRKVLERFCRQTDGAVTTEFVVLIAAGVGMTIALMSMFTDTTVLMAERVSTAVTAMGEGLGEE